ncbi:MAG: HAD family phosphatase [Ardenticatenaceae bacterium]|nr:HAD family phosphatase [Ardenticatenaceae bacterium]
MIQAVIFDFGGVLVRTPDRSSRKQWEDKLGLAEWESEQIVFNSEMGIKAQCGEVSDAALWQWVGARLALSADELAAFQEAFWAGDVLDTALIDAIRGLRPFYQTAIISNAADGLRQALHTTYPIADAFDLIVVSAEEKVMKPKPDIYLRTLERLGRQPEEAVFIDDFAHNIAAARQLGMAAIHYQPGTDMKAELAALGVTAQGPVR